MRPVQAHLVRVRVRVSRGLGAVLFPLLGPVLASSALGCSFNAVADAADADVAQANVQALVTVERADSREARADVVARVARVRTGTLDEASLKLAGLGDDFPALGTCTSQTGSLGSGAGSSSTSTAGAFGSRGLELVDVGQVSLEGPDGLRAPLVARQVPDPAGMLSGVMYSARISDPTQHAGTSPVTLTVRAPGVTGDPESLAFVAQVTLPKDLSEVRLGGLDPKDFAATTGSPADLTWQAAQDSEDLVVVDLKSADRAARCTFADVGRASLLTPATNELLQDATSLTVHRIHREHFRLDRTDRTDPRKAEAPRGEIRVDSSRTFVLTRKSRAAL
jgi:hypothetical protein